MIGRYIVAYLGAGLAFAGLDAIWLMATSEPLYRSVLHSVLIEGFRPVPAVLFYLIYLAGLTVFAIAPAIGARRWILAIRSGAVFGFFAYATYDLTNQATLIVWSTRITTFDLAWGMVLSATAATAGYWSSKLAQRQ